MTMPATHERSFVLLGAGGHARVLLALVREAGGQVRGVCDPALAKDRVSVWQGVPVLGGDEVLARIDASGCSLLLGVGQLVGGTVRRALFESLRDRGFRFPAVVHPAAWVAPGVVLDDGVQVMAGAIVQPDCHIGSNTIINTRASVDHDCVIGEHVHVAPGATLCGGVVVRDTAFIAAGATVIQGVKVGRAAVIGAGATVLRDVADGLRVLGPRNTGSKQQ